MRALAPWWDSGIIVAGSVTGFAASARWRARISAMVAILDWAFMGRGSCGFDLWLSACAGGGRLYLEGNRL